MVLLILIPDDFVPKVKVKKIPFKILKGIGIGGLIVFGIIFVDTALLWLFGSWSLADWRFQLPSVIILLYLGLGYIIGPLFKRGNTLDIIYCGVAVISILVFLHWWVPLDDVMGIRLEGGLPILLGVLIGIYVLIFMFKEPIVQKQSSIKNTENVDYYFWDINKQLHYLFNRTAYFIFWFLAVLHSMLAFYGYSILTCSDFNSYWYCPFN